MKSLDEYLLIKVRLGLFTLQSGTEGFQILLYVWNSVVCLEMMKRLSVINMAQMKQAPQHTGMKESN